MVVRKTGRVTSTRKQLKGTGDIAQQKAATTGRKVHHRITLAGDALYDCRTGKLYRSGECPPDLEETGE